ncbi:MAG: SOS response-associated peptidase [Acidobacteriota bacterium]
MCGRYTLTDPGTLLDDLSVEHSDGVGLTPRYNIAPTQHAPVVRVDPEREVRAVTHLRWGLIPSWAKDPSIGNRMINARAETVAEKPSFRSAFKRRRCLVLTDGFYEWTKTPDGKQPHHIHRAGRAPFVLAGLWEHWNKGPEGPIDSYTILTTQANDQVSALHHRMPVILDADAWDLWLDPGVSAREVLEALLVPYAGASPLEHVAVSRRVNRPANDDPEVLTPIAEDAAS